MEGNKRIHYLFRTENMPDSELERIKKFYRERGMQVAVLTEGQGNIHEALKGMLLNHG